jgi:hypothetical protein
MEENTKDLIMTDVFAVPNDIELVVDFEESDEVSRYFGKQILANKFGHNHCLQHISIIGENLARINCGFLYGCDSLKSIVIPNKCCKNRDTSPTSFISPYCATMIQDKIVRYTSLASITKPNNVSRIRCDFLGDYSVKTISSKGITEIGDHFLTKCSSLTSITIPNTVKKIGHCFVDGCTSLSFITIPYCVTEIGNNFLLGCSSDISLVIQLHTYITS